MKYASLKNVAEKFESKIILHNKLKLEIFDYQQQIYDRARKKNFYTEKTIKFVIESYSVVINQRISFFKNNTGKNFFSLHV